MTMQYWLINRIHHITKVITSLKADMDLVSLPGSNACTSGNADQSSEVLSANLLQSWGCKM